MRGGSEGVLVNHVHALAGRDSVDRRGAVHGQLVVEEHTTEEPAPDVAPNRQFEAGAATPPSAASRVAESPATGDYLDIPARVRLRPRLRWHVDLLCDESKLPEV